MSERLGILEKQIPILESKLSAMKRERKSLKAAEMMAAKWKDGGFRAKAMASLEQRAPQTQAALMEYNRKRLLPWPKGTKPHNRYACLRRKGWTRELAIEKIAAAAPP